MLSALRLLPICPFASHIRAHLVNTQGRFRTPSSALATTSSEWPRPKAVAAAGWVADMPEVLPAVTCTAQATLLTGELPNKHGVVANGWLFRDTNEVRFWQQSNRLIQAEPLYETARRRARERGERFKSAQMFWWF